MTTWENVDEGRGIQRMNIPTGWLVVIHYMEVIDVLTAVNGQIALAGQPMVKKVRKPLNGMMAMTFVSDPEHLWKIETKQGEVIEIPKEVI